MDARLASVESLIAAREYWASETEDGLQAPNRAHGLRSYFDPDGVRVLDRTAPDDSSLFALSLVGLGRNDRLRAVGRGVVRHAESRVEIERAELGLVEWFVNSPRGLEQGFTLAARSGDPAERLVLELAVTGATAALRGDSVVLTSEHGDRFGYGHLAVVDAAGRRLDSRFEVRDSSFIRLVVDDASATYPIIVDPLIEGLSDGFVQGDQAGAQLGTSVESAGDVNGDGHADVIVGAPSFDGGQVDEGAAFVFLGSPSGIGIATPTNAHAQLESNQGGGFLGPRFGVTVASAGDVNGDGFGDVIVGSPAYDGAGSAYIFHGSASGMADGNPATAQTRLTSSEPEGQFGTSVASAGDVNGDGYGDVIVGAPNFDALVFNEGAAFVYLGSASGVAHATTSTAHARLSSDQGGFPQGSFMGASVASAGDVNGDGYDDVIVGAPLYDGSGVAFAFLGSASGVAHGTPASAHAEFRSSQPGLGQPGSAMGSSVGSTGDLNGDGYDDVIVGAPNWTFGQTQEGVALIFLGSSIGLVDGNPVNAASVLQTNVAGDHLGIAVGGGGDFNGDGYVDAFAASRGPIDASTMLVWFGGASILPTLSGSYSVKLTIFKVSGAASAGDVNGDGFDDLIVGYPMAAFGGGDEGAAAVFHGGATGLWPVSSGPLFSSGAPARFESNQAGALFGAAAASAGDVNGDGYGDLIVGAPSFDGGEIDEGAAFLFLTPSTGLVDGTPSNASARFESNQANARMGSAVAAAGDVNGDGFGDVIIGAPRWDAGETDEGGAFVFLGSAAGIANGDPSTAHARFQSNWASSELGTSVAAAGDVNGDGYGDVVVGAPKYSHGEFIEGSAFVFHGSATGMVDGQPLSSAGMIESDQDLALLGHAVASAGDVNGDGFDDVVVGSYVYSSGSGAEEGAAFVVHGSATGIGTRNPTSAATQLEGNQGIARFGYSVASAGDVDRDGFGDLVVGSPLYDQGQLDEGAAFVFVGSPSGIASGAPATAQARFESDEIGAELGTSVAGADFDGDGRGDLIVGAPRYGSSDQGMAFVFRTRSSGLADGNPTTARRSFTSDQSGSAFGSTVASAGDLNGDGFADWLVGSSAYDQGQIDEGGAFVVLSNARPGPGVAGGWPVRARQRRGDGSGVRVAPGGLAAASDRFVVELFAHSPRGRERGKLEIEACELGTPFGSPGCTKRETAAWVDLGATGAQLGETVTGLSPNRLYAWRARARFASRHSEQPGITPMVRVGPWRRQQNGPTVPTNDIRTVPEPGIAQALIAGCLAILAGSRRRRRRAWEVQEASTSPVCVGAGYRRRPKGLQSVAGPDHFPPRRPRPAPNRASQRSPAARSAARPGSGASVVPFGPSQPMSAG